MKLLLLSLTLLGCGQLRPAVYIDPAFTPYVAQFELDCSREVRGVSIRFSDIPGFVDGRCSRKGARRFIEVNRVKWEILDHDEREVLLYHELGHCAMNRDHVVTTMEYEGYAVPTSIMWPRNIGGDWYYKDLRSYYINELCYG